MQVPLVDTKATYAVFYVDGNTILSQGSFSVKAGAADLSGRVTLRGGTLVGAVVTANLIGGRGPASVIVTQTDPKGVYMLRGLRNGDNILLVDMNGRRVYQGRIALNSPTLVKDVELK